LIAYRLAKTQVAHVHVPDGTPTPYEFFPAPPKQDDLIYCEIKANISTNDDQKLIRDLISVKKEVAKLVSDIRSAS
jgi:hypothetical protein